jgi:HAD superfamily hydrolase (TIGR01490 family)
MSQPPIAAIFDLDHTLVAASTGTLVLRYMRETGLLNQYLDKRLVAQAVRATLLFKAGVWDATRLMQTTVRLVRGIPVATMWQMVDGWFENQVRHVLAPGALERLAWHVAQGHVPIICTASSQFSALPVARHLAIPHAVFSTWEDDGAVMTGGVRLPIAYGAGKIYWLRQLTAAHGLRLSESYFYSDDLSDMPLLQAVRHPAAVNPSKALRAAATRREWPILTWY